MRVIDVDRSPSTNNTTNIWKAHLLLTFTTLFPPTKIMIFFTICTVLMYIPLPKSCFHCQKYGHLLKYRLTFLSHPIPSHNEVAIISLTANLLCYPSFKGSHLAFIHFSPKTVCQAFYRTSAFPLGLIFFNLLDLNLQYKIYRSSQLLSFSLCVIPAVGSLIQYRGFPMWYMH